MVNSRGIGTTAIVGIVISIAVVGVLGFYFLTKGEGVSDGGISIASFTNEVEEDASPYLSLYINNYEITGRTLMCNATVNYIGPSGGEATGARVSMYATSAGGNAVNVNVLVHGGFLVRPTGTIGSDYEDLPALSQSNPSHSVTLSFNIS